MVNCAIGGHHGLECPVGQTRLVRRRGQRIGDGNILQDLSSQIRYPKLVSLWYAYDYKSSYPLSGILPISNLKRFTTKLLIRDAPKGRFEKP